MHTPNIIRNGIETLLSLFRERTDEQPCVRSEQAIEELNNLKKDLHVILENLDTEGLKNIDKRLKELYPESHIKE